MMKTKQRFAIMLLLAIQILLTGGCKPTQQLVQSDTLTPELVPELSETSTLHIPTGTSAILSTSETVSGELDTASEEPAASQTPIPTLETTPHLPAVPAVQSTPTPNISDRLFEFVAAFGFHYAWIEPITGVHQDIELAGLGISSDVVGTATTLAFAHFSHQVVFWFRNPGEPGTLWLADIELKEARLIYTDDAEVLTSDSSFPPRDVKLDWFPNDKYVLVRPTNPNALPILVDVFTGSYQTGWSWECNSVIVSPKTSQLALLCTKDNESSIMEWSGEFWVATNPASYDIVWQWTEDYMLPLSSSGSIPTWSPDGSKVAFASSDKPNTLEVITNLGENLSLSLRVDALFPHTIRWTTEGNILLGGYREDWPASWFVVDGETGDILWSLEETAEFDLTPEQQGEQLLLRGEISMSGQYLILATSRSDIPSANQLLLVDVKNNQFIGIVADVGHGLDAFVWGR